MMEDRGFEEFEKLVPHFTELIDDFPLPHEVLRETLTLIGQSIEEQKQQLLDGMSLEWTYQKHTSEQFISSVVDVLKYLGYNVVRDTHLSQPVIIVSIPAEFLYSGHGKIKS